MAPRIALVPIVVLGVSLGAGLVSCGGAEPRPPEEAQADGSRRASILERPIDPEHVYPMVVGPSFLTRDYEIAHGAKDLLHRDVLNDRLEVLYVTDVVTMMRMVLEKDLETVGLDARALRARAVANLRRETPEIEIRDHGLLRRVVGAGGMESSLLLDDELWRRPDLGIEGDPVVAVPRRNELLVTGTRTPGGVDRLRRLARDLFVHGSEAISDGVFVRRDGRWEPLDA